MAETESNWEEMRSNMLMGLTLVESTLKYEGSSIEIALKSMDMSEAFLAVTATATALIHILDSHVEDTNGSLETVQYVRTLLLNLDA